MVSRPQRYVCRPLGHHAPLDHRTAHERHRGSARERGYSTAWDKAAKGYLRRHPLCVGCLAMGETVAATLVDHVEPHEGDRAIFWDASRWQSACRWHHDVVKQALEVRWRAGRLAVDALRLDSPEALDVARRSRKGGG